ncbi:MAG: altronate oxidoreductase, partial [Dysgonamonadaceae bacterium]|nr:altronate oxidoreductase [Dysgonamonadaceae bacterium]
TFSLAALLVLYSGNSEVPFTPNDTPEGVAFIRQSYDRENIGGWVKAILSHKSLWTEDLDAVPGLAERVAKDAALILQRGMRGALEQIL